jgi:hypothetical protein
MIALRIVGIIIAVLAIAFTAYRSGQGRMRRLDLLVAWLLSAAILSLGIYPDMYEPVFDAFNFAEGNNRRIIGVLIVSNIVLFLLYLRSTALSDAAARDIRRLVQRMAQRDFEPEAHPELRDADIILIIAAYNEEETIGDVLNGVPKQIDGLRVAHLVVSDGSVDATEQIAREHGAVVVHTINLGQGAAYQTAYQLVTSKLKARIIAVTDADGQTVPAELERMVRPIIEDKADFVNGSRMLGVYETPESKVRAVGVRFFSALVSIMTATKVTDVSSPWRAFRAEAVAKLHLQQPQFQASELLIEAVRKGLRYAEVPTTMRRRQGGATRKPSTVPYAWGFVKAVMTTWLR